MRQIDSPPPNLWQSRGPYHGFASKDWTPRTLAGRVGGIVLGIVFAAGGLMMLVSSYWLKQELRSWIPSPPMAFVISLVAVTITLAVGSFMIWLGRRLLVGSFRQISNRKGKANSRY
jgi:hypothetical protein